MFDWDSSVTVNPPGTAPNFWNGVAPNQSITGVYGVPVASVYKVTVTSTVKPPITTYYDRLGRAIRTIKNGFNNQQILTDTAYNNLGQVIAVSLPYLSGDTPLWTTTAYDALGRVVTVTAPNGTVTATTYIGRATSVTVTPVTGTAQTNTTLADAKGRTVSVWNADNSAGTIDRVTGGSTAPSISFVLDGFGRMRTTTLKGQTQTITATYDALGRQLTLNDPDKGNWSYLDNALGQVVKQTDAKSTVTLSTFDHLGRPLARTTTETAGPVENASFYYYDSITDSATNRVIKGAKGWIGAPEREVSTTTSAPGYANPGATTIHFYDNLGRPDIDLSSIDGKWFYTCTNYDLFSRPTRVQYSWRPGSDAEANNQANTTPYAWSTFGYINTYDGQSYLHGHHRHLLGQSHLVEQSDLRLPGPDYFGEKGRQLHHQSQLSGHRRRSYCDQHRFRRQHGAEPELQLRRPGQSHLPRQRHFQ